MKRIKIQFSEDYIALMDGKHEIVGWHQDEWEEDSQVVFSIVNAVQIGLLKGATSLRKKISHIVN